MMVVKLSKIKKSGFKMVMSNANVFELEKKQKNLNILDNIFIVHKIKTYRIGHDLKTACVCCFVSTNLSSFSSKFILPHSWLFHATRISVWYLKSINKKMVISISVVAFLR